MRSDKACSVCYEHDRVRVTYIQRLAPIALQVELIIHNDSVIALACGTGGRLHGCVLTVGTGELSDTPIFLYSGAINQVPVSAMP